LFCLAFNVLIFFFFPSTLVLVVLPFDDFLRIWFVVFGESDCAAPNETPVIATTDPHGNVTSTVLLWLILAAISARVTQDLTVGKMSSTVYTSSVLDCLRAMELSNLDLLSRCAGEHVIEPTTIVSGGMVHIKTVNFANWTRSARNTRSFSKAQSPLTYNAKTVNLSPGSGP